MMNKDMKTETIKQMLQERKLECFLITSPEGILWYSGIRASAGRILVFAARPPVYFFDGRYIETAKKTLVDVQVLPLTEFSTFCKTNGISKVACEAEHTTLQQADALQKQNLELVPVSAHQLRSVKSEAEIKKLQAASDITVDTFLKVKDWIRPGMTEREISRKISCTQLELGADGNSFDPIVASGPNGAFPHHRDSLRKVEDGEYVTLDFGCIREGYCSDMTRTILVGNTPRDNGTKVKAIYDIVKEAQAAGLKAARPGITGKDLDGVCREIIKGHGYEIPHGVGHGYGINVHEQPYVNALGTSALVPGNCVTVEPGIYVPGIGGVRIEDDIVITMNGCINLTERAPK